MPTDALNPDTALLLRALSALLAYPDADLRAALPEIAHAIRAARALDAKQREDLLALADEIAHSDEYEAQGRYVDLFDRGRRTSLNLFEHVHGDGRQRGPAMLDLRQRYLDAGLDPVADELPDHLPLILEYLSCRDAAELHDTLGEIAHILRALGNALLKRHSRYAAVIATVLALGDEKGLDARAPVPAEQDIDADWEEKPAFAPPDLQPAVAPEHSTT
jgi:nitrate reductase delta subunit